MVYIPVRESGWSLVRCRNPSTCNTQAGRVSGKQVVYSATEEIRPTTLSLRGGILKA